MPVPPTKPAATPSSSAMPLAVAMRTSMPSLRGMPATPTPAPMPMGPAAPTPAARPMELRPLLTSTSTPTSKLASMALARATVATVVTAPTARVGAVVGDVGLAEPGAMLGASTSCGNHVNSFQNEFGASFLRMPIAYCMPSVAPSTYDAFSPTAAAPTQDLRTRRQPHISGFAAQARDDGPLARAQGETSDGAPGCRRACARAGICTSAGVRRRLPPPPRDRLGMNIMGTGPSERPLLSRPPGYLATSPSRALSASGRAGPRPVPRRAPPPATGAARAPPAVGRRTRD